MGEIYIYEDGSFAALGYFLVSSGYLVEADKVLLVHHKGFDKWVPPGGHLCPGETFAEAAVREFKEETGLTVQALSAQPEIHEPDENARCEPAPFYVDVEREGFHIPALVQFFYMRRLSTDAEITIQESEVRDASWFGREDLATLATFAQVRSLALYALSNHPDAGRVRY
ncbi:MAG: NUDIX domain-containing protein [Micromonosporaceae bacterium]|nr:NUDIX domain-containing protein [Micromonosporaceae bacterium]